MQVQALTQTVGRAGRPAILDMTLAHVREIDPGFCDRLQAAGVPEPMLCGPYLNRTVGELAQAERIDVGVILGAVRLPGEASPAADADRRRAWPGPRLAAPIARLNLGDEIEQLRSEPVWQQFDRNAKTLVKNPELRIILMALKTGARLEEHVAAGPIAIQVLAGCVRVHLASGSLELAAGDFGALKPDIRHDVEALEPSAVLLTVALPPPDADGSDGAGED